METTSARLSGLEPLLTIEALAEYLDVPVTTIRDWRTDGKGPCAIKVGGRVRFAVSGAVAERPLVRGGIGTAAGLLDAAGPQAVYKHAILEAYIDRFTVMTTKPLQFAKRQRCTVGTSVSVVERRRKDFEALDRVAREYRADGLDVIPRRGAQLAWDAIVPFLTRRGSCPRTEALSGPVDSGCEPRALCWSRGSR